MTELIETRYIRVELTPATAAAYDRMVDGGLGHEDVIGAAERAMAVVLVVDAGIDIAAAPVDPPAFTTHQTVKLQGRALQAFFSDYNHGSTGPGGPDNAARLAVRATGHPAKFMMLPTSQAREHGLDLAATPELLTWARTSPARRSTTVELELDALAAEIEEARGPDPTGTRVPDLEPSYLDPALERDTRRPTTVSRLTGDPVLTLGELRTFTEGLPDDTFILVAAPADTDAEWLNVEEVTLPETTEGTHGTMGVTLRPADTFDPRQQ